MSNVLAFGPLAGSALFVVLLIVFVFTSGMIRYVKENKPRKVLLVTECSMASNVR